jgi:hypothetical protein
MKVMKVRNSVHPWKTRPLFTKAVLHGRANLHAHTREHAALREPGKNLRGGRGKTDWMERDLNRKLAVHPQITSNT